MEQHIAALAAKQAALRQLALKLAALSQPIGLAALAKLVAQAKRMRPKSSAVSAALVELAVSAPWMASNC